MILNTLARTSDRRNRVLPTPPILVKDDQDKTLADFIEGFTAVSGGYRASLHLSEDNDNLNLFDEQEFEELHFD